MKNLFFNCVNFSQQESVNFDKWAEFCNNSTTITLENSPTNKLGDIISFSESQSDFDELYNNKEVWNFDFIETFVAIPTNIEYHILADISTLNFMISRQSIESKNYLPYYSEKLQQLFILIQNPTKSDITIIQEIIRIYTNQQ